MIRWHHARRSQNRARHADAHPRPSMGGILLHSALVQPKRPTAVNLNGAAISVPCCHRDPRRGVGGFVSYRWSMTMASVHCHRVRDATGRSLGLRPRVTGEDQKLS